MRMPRRQPSVASVGFFWLRLCNQPLAQWRSLPQWRQRPRLHCLTLPQPLRNRRLPRLQRFHRRRPAALDLGWRSRFVTRLSFLRLRLDFQRPLLDREVSSVSLYLIRRWLFGRSPIIRRGVVNGFKHLGRWTGLTPARSDVIVTPLT